MAKEYYVIVGNNHTYSHEPKHSFEERVFGSYPSKAKAEEIAGTLFFTGNYDSVRVAHKNWNTVKGTVWTRKEERAKTLRTMDILIRENDPDESYTEWWITEGLPDGTDNEYIKEFTDTKTFTEIVKVFSKIMETFWKEEHILFELPKDFYIH